MELFFPPAIHDLPVAMYLLFDLDRGHWGVSAVHC